MKLIDLLLQELPKRGGWPGSQYDGEVMKIDNICWSYKEGCYPTAYMNGETVRKSEYEAALAASEQSAWNGEGLPPVGCKCEFKEQNKDEWRKCVIRYVSDYTIVVDTSPDKYECDDEEPCFVNDETILFRPIRTEAERKRQEIAQEMCNLFGNGIKIDEKHGYGRKWLEVYDAIAAGKIPGVKLAD